MCIRDSPISIVASTQRIVHSPKRHTFGSVIYDAARDTYYEEEPYRDIEVVDRIGSGDAYISGALYGLLSSGGDCSKAIAFGNATAAVKNTIPGDLPSSNLEEIQTIIKAHNPVSYTHLDVYKRQTLPSLNQIQSNLQHCCNRYPLRWSLRTSYLPDIRRCLPSRQSVRT